MSDWSTPGGGNLTAASPARTERVSKYFVPCSPPVSPKDEHWSTDDDDEHREGDEGPSRSNGGVHLK
jgi:hypothetical protein